MTERQIREIFRQELALFFSQLQPEQGKFDHDLNVLAAEGPEGLKRLCKERLKQARRQA